MNYYHQHPNAFPSTYLNGLRGDILACPYLATNNLNRNFIDTNGFSILIPARLDQPMRQQLLNELFEAWLEEQLSQFPRSKVCLGWVA